MTNYHKETIDRIKEQKIEQEVINDLNKIKDDILSYTYYKDVNGKESGLIYEGNKLIETASEKKSDTNDYYKKICDISSSKINEIDDYIMKQIADTGYIITSIYNDGDVELIFGLFDGMHYVSFGDSIAAGHAINDNWSKEYGAGSQYGVNGNTFTVIVPDSYTHLIHNNLINNYGEYGNEYVSTTSFARSGDRVDDLIAKLNHDVVINAIKKADIVTICIGANDVLEPALSSLGEYINKGDSELEKLANTVENNLAILADNSNATSYMSLFNALYNINPIAKYVFTTIYNPYKYLHLDEGHNGFFKPLLDTIPQMNLDVDKYIEDSFGIGNLVYYDFSSWSWKSIELDFDIDAAIKDGLLSTPAVRTLYDRVNGLDDWSEEFVTKLNTVLKNKIKEYGKQNFIVADTKSLFDTYPDRPSGASVCYNDLVNVEFTRGYTTGTMDWSALWRGEYSDDADGIYNYWLDLFLKYSSFNNAVPSLNTLDYISFDINSFATDLVTQIVEKVIVPNVDPHPEKHGHIVLRDSFVNALGMNL